MRRWFCVLAVVVVAALLSARPASAQTPPAPTSAAAICHECSWIRAQIDDIDEKIAGWERQIKTIHKISNLSDPGIQTALKDIDKDIATLKAKKAQLLIKLAECERRCAAAKAAEAPKPAPPKPSTSAGGGPVTTPGPKPSAGGGAPGGTSVAPRGPPPDTAPRVCVIEGRLAWAPNDHDRLFLPPRRYKKWPAWPPDPPAGTGAYENWDHLMYHLDDFDEDWDVDDIWDITDDIEVVIDDAMAALEDNPFNEAAFDRLNWAQDELAYFRAAKAWYRARFGHPYWEDCPPSASIQPKADWSIQPRLPSFESGIIDKLNQLRQDPPAYGRELEHWNGGGADRLDAIRYLRTLDPRPLLIIDPRLTDAARQMVTELGQTGGTSHIGEGGLTIGKRLQKRGVFAGISAEAFSLGQTLPEGVVRQLVIDEGVPTHFHRIDLLDGRVIYVGCACGPHPKFGSVCVLDLAGSVMAPPPPPPP